MRLRLQSSSYQSGPSTTQGNIPLETRYATKGSVSWYRPNTFFGNHEVKSGFDYIANTIMRGWESRGSNLNYRLQFSNGQPFQIVTWNYPVIPRSAVNYFGAYVRDNRTIARRLTLNLAARIVHDHGFVPEQCRQDADPPAFGPSACFARVDMKIWKSVAPRLYAAYDASGDGQTVIKVEKSFRLTARQNVSVRANVYNALNVGTITARNVRSGVDYLRPTAIISPRIVEFSGSYTF